MSVPTLQGFDHATLKANFRYFPLTGNVYRIKKNGALQGPLRSEDGEGYLRVRFRGKTIRLHQLGFFFFYGYIPTWPMLVDHEDRNRSNNRAQNLRAAHSSENQANKSVQKNNTSGHSGVHFDKDARKWRFRLRMSGKLVASGYAMSKEDASEMYNYYKQLYYMGFARLNAC